MADATDIPLFGATTSPVSSPTSSPMSATESAVEAIQDKTGSILPTLTLAIGALALALSLFLLMMMLRMTGNFTQMAPALSLASVDLSTIVGAKETEFAAMVAKPDVKDADREKAFDLIKAFGPQLDAAIKALQQECKCTLITKGAIVASPEGALPDLTAALKAKLGIKP